MAGNIHYNSDVELDGKLILKYIPDASGEVLTYNLQSKQVGKRSYSQLISDMGLATVSWSNTTFIPKSHPVFNVTQANINSWNTNLNRTYSFAEITNKPTTIAGYGITDAYTKAQTDDKFIPYTGATKNIDLGVRTISAEKFIKKGGTAAQFLKADGSVDVNSYALNTHAHTFGQITNKPTTIAGYGITDAYTKTETNTEIKNSIDAIRIGGRNLLLRGPNYLMTGSDQGNFDVSIREEDYVKITFKNNGNVYNNVGGLNGILTSEARIKGETYTVSFEVNSEINTGIYFYPSENRVIPSLIPITNGEWIKVEHTYIQSGETVPGSRPILFGFQNGLAGKVVKYRNLKLERGNKATPWTPAPEDQVSDWNQSDETAFDFIKNKPTADIAKGVQAFNWENHATQGYLKLADLNGQATQAWVKANFDKYTSWNLKTEGVQRVGMTSGSSLDIKGGTNVTTSYGAGGVVTINSTDTTYTAGSGIGISGTTITNSAPNIDQKLSISGMKITLDRSGGTVTVPSSNLVTSTTSTGLTNLATTNTNTYLNVVEGGTTLGSSTQITGTGSVTVSSDANGKLTINGVNTNTTYTGSSGITLSGTDFRPTYGTAANTIAQGNDARINNGQTAFGWGNHATQGYLKSANLNGYATQTWVTSQGYLTSLPNHTHPWSQITSTPTTLAGYGITDFTSHNANNSISNPNNTTVNAIGYVGGINLFGVSDGGLINTAYSSAWQSQIYQDFRTGQTALRGKNNGTWTSWRTVWDSGNFNPANKADTSWVNANFLKKDISNTVTPDFEITNGYGQSISFVEEYSVDISNRYGILSLGSDDGCAMYYRSGGNYFEAYIYGISGRVNNNPWLLANSNNVQSYMEMPETGNTNRVLSIGAKIGSTTYYANTQGVIVLPEYSTYTQGTNIVISGTTISVSSSPTFSGAVTATSFFESSLRKYKTNIQPFTNSALDLIDKLDIVTYDRTEGVKDKIGIIADDSPKEFLSEKQEEVDLYKTIFIQAKAIQELKEEIDNLKKMITHAYR